MFPVWLLLLIWLCRHLLLKTDQTKDHVSPLSILSTQCLPGWHWGSCRVCGQHNRGISPTSLSANYFKTITPKMPFHHLENWAAVVISRVQKKTPQRHHRFITTPFLKLSPEVFAHTRGKNRLVCLLFTASKKKKSVKLDCFFQTWI